MVRTHEVCGAGESLKDVALDAGPGGPVAYVALWRWAAAPGAGDADAGEGGGRVVALGAETGALLAAYGTTRVPDRLLLGPAPGGGARRVYRLEIVPPRPPSSGRLVALDAETLSPSAPTLPLGPLMAGAGPGRRAPLRVHRRWGRLRQHVLAFDLTTGAVAPLLTLPGEGMGLAATAETLYAVDPDRGRLWSIDRRSGRLRGATAVGRTPIALTLRPAG